MNSVSEVENQLVDKASRTTRSPDGNKDGVVYTPRWVVDLMLESVFDIQPFWDGALVLDPACGDGAFLGPVVELVVSWAQDRKLTSNQISELLQRSVVGRDIDSFALSKCRDRLTKIATSSGIAEPDWDLRQADSLLETEAAFSGGQKYSHIVGNPPYIRIQDLPTRTRRELQAKYCFCQKGSTDIFLAFFELGQQLLTDDGVLAFITSRSYFDSAAAQAFRRSVTRSGLLHRIIDFGNSQVFPDVSTYTAISILKVDAASSPDVQITRIDAETQLAEWTAIQPRSNLGEKRWHVVRESDASFIKDTENRGPTLGEICSIRVGLATLRDNIYVNRLISPVSLNDEQSDCVIQIKNGEFRSIESGALRHIAKVSKLKSPDEDQRLVIIYPYETLSGNAVPWSSSSQKRFPKAMNYLEENRDELATRGHGVRSWFEYGSTQGLTTLFGKKLLVPSMSKDASLLLWTREEWTFYSGYGIFFSGDIFRLAARLAHDDFRRYAGLVGRTLRGGWFSMTTTSLSSFSLTREDWVDCGFQLDNLTSQPTLGI